MHNELEDYLAKIEKQLSAFPAEQRDEELREIRSHLEMIVNENIAQGDKLDQAIAKALQQFGAAKEIASALNNTRANKDQRARTILAGVMFVAIWIYSQRLMNWLLKNSFTIHQIHLSPYLVLAVAYFASGWVAEAIVPRKVLFAVVIPFLAMSGFVILLALTVLMLPALMGVPASMESAIQTSSQILIEQLKNTGVFAFAFLGAWMRRWQVDKRSNQSTATAE